jgi:signal recognition particle receptor subunit beta
MPLVHYAAREILCKIVYYGPARSGKSTNLQWLQRSLPEDQRDEMVSLATESDRTLFFDFLPLDLGDISGFRTRLQLYTVPGQVYYNATRKLVLRGADGVVFVADSQPDRLSDNIASLRNLEENLLEHGIEPGDVPLVLQYNKQDLPAAVPVTDLDAALNPRALPSRTAAAIRGNGIIASLRDVCELVLRSVSRQFAAPVS